MKSYTIVFADGTLPDHVKATSVQFEGSFAVFYVDGKFLVAYPATRIKEVK